MNKPPVKKKLKTGSQKARNSAARLMAVQAVYQMHKNAQTAAQIIPEFLTHRIGVDPDGDEMVTPDADLFSNILNGVEEHITQLSDMITRNRTGQREQPMESLLFAILLCGSFELMVRQDIDAPLIIADYLNVTEAFFEDQEARLIHAILDSIRKTVR